MMKNATYQGVRGSYSEGAVKQLGHNPIPCTSFVDCISMVEDGNADYTILPIENSTEGSVGAVNDILSKTALKITGETYYHVRHCLIGRGKPSEVYSHPQALGQCSIHIRGLKQIPVFDTAGAVQMIHDMERDDVAAIASREAAKLYDMPIIQQDINDVYENYTHFLQLGGEEPARTTHSKTTITFTLHHEQGALQTALNALQELNLTRIESRPQKNGRFEYNFSVDFEGHKDDHTVREALVELKRKTTSLKILGSY